MYEIHVFTGFKKHASTDSMISCIVIGTDDESGVIHLNDGERKVNSFKVLIMSQP